MQQGHPIYLKPERLRRERLSILPSIQEARAHPELIKQSFSKRGNVVFPLMALGSDSLCKAFSYRIVIWLAPEHIGQQGCLQILVYLVVLVNVHLSNPHIVSLQ